MATLIEKIVGYSRKDHPLWLTYSSWKCLSQRCCNPRNSSFKNYGERGITVCSRWQGENGFANFLADMGQRPSKQHSLDRIDNSVGYEPANCRWATRLEQQRNCRSNRLVSAWGKTQCLRAWAMETGIPRSTLFYRLKSGMEPEQALSTAPGTIHNHKRGDERHSTKITFQDCQRLRQLRLEGWNKHQLAAEFGISASHARCIYAGKTRTDY